MAKKVLSVQKKIEKILFSGKTLTPAQISKKFEVANPYNPVYEMEQKGYLVERTYKKLKNGRSTVVYSV